MVRIALVLVLVLFANIATAAPTIDWASGLVTASGIGLADRQAPNPAVARGTSKRKAEDAARKVLAKELRALPLAGGGTLADKLSDKAIAERLERAIANASTVSAEPETDGAWTVTLAVPTEIVRQAITGGPRAIAGEDKGPATIVIEGVKATPAIGYTVGGIAGATVWVAAVPAWAKDAPRVKAKGAKAGEIAADVRSASPSTLFVLVTK